MSAPATLNEWYEAGYLCGIESASTFYSGPPPRTELIDGHPLLPLMPPATFPGADTQTAEYESWESGREEGFYYELGRREGMYYKTKRKREGQLDGVNV